MTSHNPPLASPTRDLEAKSWATVAKLNLQLSEKASWPYVEAPVMLTKGRALSNLFFLPWEIRLQIYDYIPMTFAVNFYYTPRNIDGKEDENRFDGLDEKSYPDISNIPVCNVSWDVSETAQFDNFNYQNSNIGKYEYYVPPLMAVSKQFSVDIVAAMKSRSLAYKKYLDHLFKENNPWSDTFDPTKLPAEGWIVLRSARHIFPGFNYDTIRTITSLLPSVQSSIHSAVVVDQNGLWMKRFTWTVPKTNLKGETPGIIGLFTQHGVIVNTLGVTIKPKHLKTKENEENLIQMLMAIHEDMNTIELIYPDYTEFHGPDEHSCVGKWIGHFLHFQDLKSKVRLYKYLYDHMSIYHVPQRYLNWRGRVWPVDKLGNGIHKGDIVEEQVIRFHDDHRWSECLSRSYTSSLYYESTDSMDELHSTEYFREGEEKWKPKSGKKTKLAKRKAGVASKKKNNNVDHLGDGSTSGTKAKKGKSKGAKKDDGEPKEKRHEDKTSEY
ncbi:hypothetical protein TWF694_003366 [Orbilia ellipsospora]|uniref:Uncharacterized protein n=1 Tax=Orbilia ellipsospora TaxID=2528407 RepID=A0AAV9X3Y3_9PEZI